MSDRGRRLEKVRRWFLSSRNQAGAKNVTRYSPLKGVIADIPTRVGETVLGGVLGTTLMTIADMSKTYVEVNVEEGDISKIAVGRPARIIVNAFHEKEISRFGNSQRLHRSRTISCEGIQG